VTSSCTPTTLTAGQNSTCTAAVAGQGNPSQVVTWSVSPTTAGTVTGGVFTSSATLAAITTATITAASTVPGYTNVTGSATITINPATPTITSVSLACTSTSITDVQTTSCTPTVTGTGSFTNTVNLSVNPASAGTLSATSGVSSGTAVTFTPASTGASTPTITAVSTADSTKSGAVQITVTVRKITISSPTGNIWLANCSELFFYSIAQTGILNGDTLHIDPYQPATFTSTPGSTFTVSLGIGNEPNGSNLCSPGAYDEYVTGTDGARSNDQYIPILSPWNMWAGYNTTDEFQTDFAAGTTCPYKLTDGTPDGACLPGAGLVSAVDGDYLAASNLGSSGVWVNAISTGADVSGAGRTSDVITDIAMKNQIPCYTQSTRGMLSCFNATKFAPTVVDQSLGIAPASIAMSTGCNSDPNTATVLTYDQEATVIDRLDVVRATSGGTVTIGSANSVSLSGFSPASQLTTTLARYVVAWDGSCKAAVLAPVLTGGTNPDGTKAYSMEFALVDMAVGTMRQLGTYVTTSIPSTAIRMVADPSGNDVVIASTDQTAGKTVLTKVSWTLDSNENPTFTVTTLGSAPPIGVYGVSLGILPSSVVPNGTTIRVGQRQQHFALANQ